MSLATINSDLPTVPRGSLRWSLRVPVIRKREQELDPVLLGGGNDLVKSLETICTCVDSCLAVLKNLSWTLARKE